MVIQPLVQFLQEAIDRPEDARFLPIANSTTGSTCENGAMDVASALDRVARNDYRAADVYLDRFLHAMQHSQSGKGGLVLWSRPGSSRRVVTFSAPVNERLHTPLILREEYLDDHQPNVQKIARLENFCTAWAQRSRANPSLLHGPISACTNRRFLALFFTSNLGYDVLPGLDYATRCSIRASIGAQLEALLPELSTLPTGNPPRERYAQKIATSAVQVMSLFSEHVNEKILYKTASGLEDSLWSDDGVPDIDLVPYNVARDYWDSYRNFDPDRAVEYLAPTSIVRARWYGAAEWGALDSSVLDALDIAPEALFYTHLRRSALSAAQIFVPRAQWVEAGSTLFAQGLRSLRDSAAHDRVAGRYAALRPLADLSDEQIHVVVQRTPVVSGDATS